MRSATPNDYDALGEVMFDAVRSGDSLYSEQQRQAWVPFARTGTAWHDRLSGQTIFVAEIDATIVGFMSLTDEGYIDLAFIRPIAQKSGLFRKLFQSIETKARELSIQRLWVHASLMAQPAFSAMGFEITQTETVEINGESFQRFEMEQRFLPDMWFLPSLICATVSNQHLLFASRIRHIWRSIRLGRNDKIHPSLANCFHSISIRSKVRMPNP